MQREQRRKTTYGAPVAWIDLAAFGDDGEPYEIFACHDCSPWHAEVHVDDDGAIFVREWHAVECPQFEELVGQGPPEG